MDHVNDIDDRWSRRLGIPGFGLVIPHATGLMGQLGPSDVAFWVGSALFVALAWAIWEGNRWLLFRQRERLDWFTQPVGKLLYLVVGCVLFTAPLTALVVGGWFWIAGVAHAPGALLTVMLTNVICVLVVTHLYETVFLIKARHDDRLALERSQRTRAEAELAALRAQVDPHFLFNSLTTLSWLIERDPEAALEFNERLASVYRYILSSRDRDLVQLSEELAFLHDCVKLLEVRFGSALRVTADLEPGQLDRCLLPPSALQLLVENAVKHNRFSEREPLHVTVELLQDTVRVHNVRRSRRDSAGTGVGLRNLAERCRLLLGRDIDIQALDDSFTVSMPIARMGA